MLLGIVAGLACAVGWLGQLLIRLLGTIIVPLVVTSILTGVASVAAGELHPDRDWEQRNRAVVVKFNRLFRF